MSERRGRGPWYLITGFVLGAVFGLAYTWVVDPVEYVDTAPGSMRADFKDEYRALIASAFVASGDLARAEARLALLGDTDVARVLTEQAQLAMAKGQSPEDAQALGLLSIAVGQGLTPVAASPHPSDTALASETTAPTMSPSETATILPTITPTSTLIISATVEIEITETPNQNPGSGDSLTPTSTSITEVTRTALPTGTELPTRTPTATPGAPFVLRDRTFVCDQSLGNPLIQVLAEDVDGRAVPGVEVVVNWDEGENHFFTGLKPELGLGYADFIMTPGVVYALRLVDGGEIISELTAEECETAAGSQYWGSWLLVFAQP